jgi:hypothetical protein
VKRSITISTLTVIVAVAILLMYRQIELPSADAGEAVNNVPPVVRHAECRWASTPITLDGVLDEPAWKDAPVIKDFAVWWEKRVPKTATKARLLWDGKYFYFAAEMEDVDIYADITEHNGMCWHNDVFEVFLKPSTESLAYYEFQVNAANTQLEMLLPSRGAGGYDRFHHEKLGIESRVRVDGTLNHWQDRDKGWTVEGRIPWTGFAATGGAPKPGSSWRFALCRYDYSVGFEYPEQSCTAPVANGSFHHYEDYGELTFVGGH